MGLLDSVIGAIGAMSAPHSNHNNGGRPDLVSAVVAMLGQQGGLAGLVQKFQQGGLGDIAASWVGTGQNLPITPDQLGQVLGPDVLGGLLSKLGGAPTDAPNSTQDGTQGGHQGAALNDLLGPLSQLLPQVVDKLTPNGHLPQGEQAGGLGELGSLLGGLIGGGRR